MQSAVHSWKSAINTELDFVILHLITSSPHFMNKIFLALFCLTAISTYAQTTGSNFGLGGYQQTIKLSTTKTTDVYTAVEKWFNNNTGIFTVKNTEPTVEAKEKNKNDVEAAYGNSRPLQSLDPNDLLIVTGKQIGRAHV